MPLRTATIRKALLGPRRLSSCQFLLSHSNSRGRLFSGWSKRHNDEEHFISQAITAIISKKPEITVQVEKVQLIGCNLLPGAAERVIASSKVRIKCLTHVDTITDAALRHQIAFVEVQERRKYPENNQQPTAIFALNIKEGTKAKQLRPVHDALFGAATLVAEHRPILVCGLPNAGKSSLILPLTKERTLKVKNKRDFHLPKVSSKAGMTLGIKSHVLESGKGARKTMVTLLDSPGLRPRLQGADPRTVALLLASKVTEPFSGYQGVASHDAILRLLLQAVNNHAHMSSAHPAYMGMLGLNSPIEDPNMFIEAYRQGEPWGHDNEIPLIRKWQSGEFGGLIFTPYREEMREQGSMLRFNRSSAIVYMNEAAKRLVELATGNQNNAAF